jgi:hypothetical protein
LSTLTKVFIVLLVVFSIAFSTMTVSMVAQTTDWRDTAMKFEEHARIADTNLRNMIAASAALEATARDTARGQLEKIAELEGQLQTNSGELARIRADLAKAESERSSSETMNRALIAQLEMARSAEGEIRTQRDSIEKRNIDLERRNIDLSDRVNELTAQVSVLVEQRRQFEQQINVLRNENERLSRAGGQAPAAVGQEAPAGPAMGNVRPLTPAAPAAISGRVLAVSDNLVTISVGQVDGVRGDMVFVVHRDGDYIGDLKISKVDPNQSAGRMVRSSRAPTRGDLVTDAVAMAGPRG